MPKYYIAAPGDNFDICLREKLYGQKQNILRNWDKGDRVIYYVDTKLAALCTVTGEPYFDARTKVWPDNTYPYRINVAPDLVLSREHWVRADAEMKAKFAEFLGKHWMLHIRAVRPIPAALFQYLESLMKSKPSVVHEPPREEFKVVQREAQKQVKKRREAEPPPRAKKPSEEEQPEELIGSTAEVQSHNRTQWYLIKLGRALGCDVWVARNDRSKSYKGEAFADLCLKKLPNLGFDSDTMRTIELIDVLWLQSNVIQCAFEVEHTTLIFSGLLRLADLVSSQPNINIKLFIVAPQERKQKVIQQLNRPMFRERLCDLCKYIPYSKLEATLAKIEDLAGYLQVGLVEKIAESCKQRDSLHD